MEKKKNQFKSVAQAQAYSTYRYKPPPELIQIIVDYLEKEVPRPFGRAVDVGCGSGQSTVVLSPYFEEVIGCDVSEAQINQAMLKRKPANVKYKSAPAERLPVADQSVQLLTAATCFHWLDRESFFKEARRVLVPGGTLAVYASCAIYPMTEDTKTNAILKKLTDKILYEDMKYYRSPCVQQLLEQYENISFPFNDVIRVHDICQTYIATASDAAGYIRSMSTYQNYRNVHPKEAEYLLEEYENSLMEILGTKSTPERTPLTYRREYFLIMCRNGEKSKDEDLLRI